jgi:cytochrome c oxidase subunit IV
VSDTETPAPTPAPSSTGEGEPGPPAERDAEENYGVSVIPPEEGALFPGEERPHPKPAQYVMIAVVLVVLTALEVTTSYLVGEIPKGLIVVLLLVMGLVKFVLVASWYMHLRTDKKVFRRFFILGGTAAILLYLIVLSTLHVFSGGA